MTPEVQELYEALIKEDTIYCHAKEQYEELRARLIREIGYNAFRDRQKEAFMEIDRARARAEARRLEEGTDWKVY